MSAAEYALALRRRYDAFGTPGFARAAFVGGWAQGASWWTLPGGPPAANDDHGDRAELFAREAVRLRARVFGLRLSECVHDDGRTRS